MQNFKKSLITAMLLSTALLFHLAYSQGWNVELVSTIACWGEALDVEIQNNYAYVATDVTGLKIVNISDLTNPVEIGYYDTPGEACGVVVSGNYAYVADGLSGLRIIDVANPANPVEIGYIVPPGQAYGIAVSGNYAYIATYFAGLRIINVTNPAQPVETGDCGTPGFAFDVAISGNYAYVADGPAGLRIINISNPNHPFEVGYYDDTDWAYGIVISDNYAYLGYGGSGLSIFQVSNPGNPVQTGYYNTSGSSRSVAISDNYAYVADYYYFEIYDCSQAVPVEKPSAIHPLSFILYPCYPNPFNPSTGLKYSLDHGGYTSLIVYDVNGREVAVLVEGYRTAGLHQVEFNGENLPSGVYFARLQSEGFSQTRKLVLMK